MISHISNLEHYEFSGLTEHQWGVIYRSVVTHNYGVIIKFLSIMDNDFLEIALNNLPFSQPSTSYKLSIS